ncbi:MULTISPECIES: DUF1837 domain-containing protein [Modicisalibacter]|uniref:HamA C-terminal domain-containing protein n=1 Tax=Modicisalibacter TaxID=574347 RepID=UPI00100C1755|nr:MULTISPECIES: DUF1837 domain-containing protein [Halomonadaceae]MBZ9557474.1 DUF1837 domain-containing protein [Modicisalibacter sp. R2A 31.J]MBZ9573860.1 DUF1837 domain-containing protein [Modicisalibacter sp. MOD 31.J]
MEQGLESTFNTLLGDFSSLSPRIKHLPINASSCGERVNIRCSYISFRDGKQTFTDFINIISEHIIPFCIPRKEIEKSVSDASSGDLVAAGRAMTALQEKARKLFIRAKKGSNRSGEAGEIVLYIFNEWLLKAPQIVSKMYLKTNHQMPVHGTDGIHAKYQPQEKKLNIFWGESKAHATVESALSSALDSIKEFIDDEQEGREIDIISSYLDLTNIDDQAREAFLQYLDPYCEESNDRITTHSCLLIFSQNGPTSDKLESAAIEEEFIEELTNIANRFIQKLNDNIEAKGLSDQRFEFFLLPVPSAQEFRDKFQEKIGWPK